MRLAVATPIEISTTPPAKLASGEKHMLFLFYDKPKIEIILMNKGRKNPGRKFAMRI